MTTGNEPKIEEQIEKAAHQDWCRWWSHGDLCSCGAVSALEKPVPVEPEHDEFIEILRSFGKAYPLDIFGPVTEDEQRLHGSLITRNSAEMGRHCAKYMVKAADVIESLQSALQTCKHNSSVTMDELGEMRDALQRAQEKAVDDCKLWRDRRDEALTALEKAEAINRRMVELIKNDAHADRFLSVSQYRAELLKEVEK